MKKILVTGGLGFIGSHLVRKLQEDDENEITIIDDCSVGKPRQSISDLNAETLRLDVTGWISDEPFDEIYHLAGTINTKLLKNDPYLVLSKNVEMMKRLIEHIRRHGGKLLFVSTQEVVNGISQGSDSVNEKRPVGFAHPFEPRWAYAEAKAYCEMMLSHSAINYRIVRLSNVYGGDMCHRYVVRAFIEEMLRRPADMKINSPDDTRSFIYVDDVVRGLIVAMEKLEGDIVNIGNSESHAIFEVAQKLLSIIGSPTNLYPGDASQVEVRNTDISKASSKLKWAPQTKIDDGLALTVDWYRRNRT